MLEIVVVGDAFLLLDNKLICQKQLYCYHTHRIRDYIVKDCSD